MIMKTEKKSIFAIIIKVLIAISTALLGVLNNNEAESKCKDIRSNTHRNEKQ